MPNTVIFSKEPRLRISGNQLINIKPIKNIMQTYNMDEVGKNKFEKINGRKRQMEESWSNDKYFYLFINEIN